MIVLDAPRGLEPQFLESKSSVLPLDEGAKIGEGTESRTLACGFGDRRATITLHRRIGAGEGDRTLDNLLGRQELYR